MSHIITFPRPLSAWEYRAGDHRPLAVLAWRVGDIQEDNRALVVDEYGNVMWNDTPGLVIRDAGINDAIDEAREIEENR